MVVRFNLNTPEQLPTATIQPGDMLAIDTPAGVFVFHAYPEDSQTANVTIEFNPDDYKRTTFVQISNPVPRAPFLRWSLIKHKKGI